MSLILELVCRTVFCELQLQCKIVWENICGKLSVAILEVNHHGKYLKDDYNCIKIHENVHQSACVHVYLHAKHGRHTTLGGLRAFPSSPPQEKCWELHVVRSLLSPFWGLKSNKDVRWGKPIYICQNMKCTILFWDKFLELCSGIPEVHSKLHLCFSELALVAYENGFQNIKDKTQSLLTSKVVIRNWMAMMGRMLGIWSPHDNFTIMNCHSIEKFILGLI